MIIVFRFQNLFAIFEVTVMVLQLSQLQKLPLYEIFLQKMNSTYSFN